VPEKSYLVTASDYLRAPSTELSNGLNCQHCVDEVFEWLADEQTGVPGFVPERSSFDLGTGKLVVHSETEIVDTVVASVVAEAGFKATLFTPDTSNTEGAV